VHQAVVEVERSVEAILDRGGDLLVPLRQVKTLVAEDTERRELGPLVGVDEKEEVERALLVDLAAVFGDVGLLDRFEDGGTGAAGDQVLLEGRVVEDDVGVIVNVGGRGAARVLQIVVHRVDEVAVLVHDVLLRDVLAVEVVEDLARLLVHVLFREVELVRVGEHRLVPGVDELAAAFGDLSGERHRTTEGAAEREAASAGSVARFVQRRHDAGCLEAIGAYEAGEARADDPDAHLRWRLCAHHPRVRRGDGSRDPGSADHQLAA